MKSPLILSPASSRICALPAGARPRDRDEFGQRLYRELGRALGIGLFVSFCVAGKLEGN